MAETFVPPLPMKEFGLRIVVSQSKLSVLGKSLLVLLVTLMLGAWLEHGQVATTKIAALALLRGMV